MFADSVPCLFRKGSRYGDSLTAWLLTSLFLNPKPQSERYILVHLLDRKKGQFTSAALFSPFFTYHLPSILDQMADSFEIGESESSGEDSVSLTSTAASPHREDKIYEVECILAEETVDDVTWYLVKWKGYSEHENSWEPREVFNSEEIFQDWNQRQMRITRGREKPFDVQAWLERQHQHGRETEKRKQRRARKRRRLNMEVDALSSSSEIVSKLRSPAKEARESIRRYSSSSSSASVDGDSSLAKLSHEAPKVNWTNEEKCTLERGLKDAQGPNWDEILGWYGPRGTINRALKDKALGDLREKTRELREEFVIAGREPPSYYLDTRSHRSEAKIPTKARAKAGSDDRGKGSGSKEEGSSDSESTIDSLMKEIKEKTSRKKKALMPKGTSKANMKPVLPKMPRRETPNPKSTPDVVNKDLATRISRPKSANKSDMRAKSPTAETKNHEPELLTPNPVRAEASDRSAPGTAKQNIPLARVPTAPTPARAGAVGSGPADPSSTKTNPIEIVRKPVVGVNAGINWKSEPKRRKTLPTTNTAGPVKRFTKLSIQNSVMKSRRNEPAPNRDNLIFLDRKTGKTPKAVPGPSATESTLAETTKTPFQEFQENLAAGKAEADQDRERETRESEDIGKATDAMLVDETEKPQPSMANIGKSEAEKPSGMSEKIDKPPLPSPALVSFQAPTAQMSLDLAPNPPPNAPKGPKQNTDRPAASPLSEPSKRPLLPAFLGPRSIPSLPSPRALHDSEFTLMNDPLREKRRELMTLYDNLCILGDLRIGIAGSEDLERIRVKFLGLDYEMHKLLLTVKVEPRTMNFDFTKACLASECQNYFLTVSAYLTCFIGFTSKVLLT